VRVAGGPEIFVRWSPDGKELAAISQFGPVLLYDASTFKRARTFSVGMRMVAYNHDGTLLATAEGRDGARVWDAALPGEPMAVPSHNQDWSPDGSLEQLNALNTPRAVLLRPDGEREARVYWVDFSPDGRHVLTTQASGHVRVWDAQTGRMEKDLAVSSAEVRVATFSPSGSTILAGDTNGSLSLWSLDANTVASTLASPIAEKNAVTGIAFSPDGGTVVTSHEKASGPAVVIWGTKVWSSQERPGFRSAAFSHDGKWLALGGAHLELANTRALQPVRDISVPQITYGEMLGNSAIASDPRFKARINDKVPMAIEALSFSPDGAVLAAGCADGTIRLVGVPQ
jgi:WD40 repeat protein